MGNFICAQSESDKTLVLQTGILRGNNITSGVDSLNIKNPLVVHRWLDSSLESKYEAFDFVTKFNLGTGDFFNIYDEDDYLLSLKSYMHNETQVPNHILDKINIVVACGSTSLQAFKITRNGPQVLLPINPNVLINSSILGEKHDTNLNFETLNFFGGKSGEDKNGVANSVLKFLNANAFYMQDGVKIPTNIIIVNQLGYSILGFNPRDGTLPPVPTSDQKVVSIKNYAHEFKINRKKTQLITVLQNLMNDVQSPFTSDNLHLVARQCKVNLNGKHEELAGQWACQTYTIMMNEPLLGLKSYKNHINRVLDLGGGSGTFYNKNHLTNLFEKDTNAKEFMKTEDSTPNDFSGDIMSFVRKFNEEFSQ